MVMTGYESGVTRVDAQGGVVWFADAAASPLGADEKELAEVARRVLEQQLQKRLAVLYALQQHGALTYLFASEGCLAPGAYCVGRCDGLLTAEAGVGLVVRNADCLPVALLGGGSVAMLHAGWRGLAADILGRAVGRMAGELGVAPAALTAVIGPGVGPCHFQVGGEVTAGLAAHRTVELGWRHDGAVDLSRYAAARLRALGVEDVRVVGGCTACSPRSYSYRRDRSEAGRMWSAAVILPP